MVKLTLTFQKDQGNMWTKVPTIKGNMTNTMGYAQAGQGQGGNYLEEETIFHTNTDYWRVHHEVGGHDQITLQD